MRISPLFCLLMVTACGSSETSAEPSFGGAGGDSFWYPEGIPPEIGAAVEANPWETGPAVGLSSEDVTSLGGASSTAPASGGTGPITGGKVESGPPPRLIFSGYYETTHADKYLTIAHADGGIARAGGCVISVFSNGSTEASRKISVPELLIGEERLLCTTAAVETPCIDALGYAPFNGDDALVLTCGGIVTDSFGRVGEDPGTAWSAGGISSKDQELVRCPSLGRTETTSPFSIDAEWVKREGKESPEVSRARCPGIVSAGGATSG